MKSHHATPSVYATRTSRISRNWTGVWFVAIGAALWGTDAVFRLTLLKSYSSSQLVLMEHVLLAMYAIPVVWLARRQFRGLTWKQWGAVLFISWGGSAIATVLFTAAFQYGNASVVLLLQKLQPLFAIFMAWWLLKERLPKQYGIYLMIAIVGTYLLTFGFHSPFAGVQHAEALGSILALAAAALWGGSTVMGRLLLDTISFEAVTGIRFLVALPLLIVLVVWSHGNWGTMWSNTLQISTLLNLVLQALLPGLVSLLLYYRGLSVTKASYATLAELAFPATGLLLNWCVFHQGITFGQFFGFLLIWITVFQLGRLNGNQVGEPVAARSS